MLKVAAYARVSTDKDDQINSLDNQRRYFETYIKSRHDWEYAGIFFDEGVTGTQTKKRAGFNSMIKACEEGDVNLILTKEVSRFARNTVDTLEYTRLLKKCGVGVIFISDNIDTRENDGEFRLSIMASVAQEESRKTSERVKWGQRRAMENGVVFGNNSIFGFDVKNGRLTVNEKEAEIVRLIFHKYANERKGAHIIAKELYDAGIKPPRSSKNFWSSAAIMRLLRNEKYAGDLLQKKYITEDYLTHKKTINNTNDKIFISDHHQAIISRDLWNRTQAELARRSAGAASKEKYSSRYWCSGKIICGGCGKKFIIRRSRKPSGEYIVWECHSRATHGRGDNGCGIRTVNNKSLLTCMRFVTERTGTDFDIIAKEIADEIHALRSRPIYEAAELQRLINETESKKLRMLDSYFAEEISSTEMDYLKKQYNDRLERLNSRLISLERGHDASFGLHNASELHAIITDSAVFSESVYGEILDRITVYDEYMLIQLKYLNYAFKISYSTHGYKERYTTVIETCDTVKDNT